MSTATAPRVILSATMSRLKAQAESLGLVVTVEDNDSNHVLQSVTLVVARPQVEEQNMLDVVRNREAVRVHAVRTFERGRWTHHAYFVGYTVRRDLTLRGAHYTIAGLAR